jgi:hypothetical protein
MERKIKMIFIKNQKNIMKNKNNKKYKILNPNNKK